VVGEAGVGKSRLVYECLHSYHTQGWQVLESTSVSYGKATPYFPVLDLLLSTMTEKGPVSMTEKSPTPGVRGYRPLGPF
jgi:hypothetical protein